MDTWIEGFVKGAPLAIEHPVLGRLQLNRQRDAFEGRRVLEGRSCELTVAQSAPILDLERRRAELDAAVWVVRRVEARLAEARRAIAAELLELWNDTWRQDDEDVLDAEGFLAHLALESLGVDSEGTATLYYGDGDLFGGHWIEVWVSAEGQVTHVGLIG